MLRDLFEISRVYCSCNVLIMFIMACVIETLMMIKWQGVMSKCSYAFLAAHLSVCPYSQISYLKH